MLAQPLGLLPPKDALRGLGRVVVLAGPNGAGKSRYLQLVQLTINHMRRFWREEADLERAQKDLRQSLQRLPGRADMTPEQREASRKSWTATLESYQARFDIANQFKEAVQSDGLPTDGQLVVLTYSIGGVHDPREQTRVSMENIISANRNPGFAQAHASLAAYFERVAKNQWSALHPSAREHPNVIRGVEDANSFNEILDALVGGRVEPEHDETGEIVAKFRGRVLQHSELSNGEAVLITWAIILHRQRSSLTNAIVIIDEPENHLHPDACIRALSVLRDKILGPDGQIWVGTHSVQLIAFAGIESIWMVENGHIEYAGNKVDTVVDRLLGGRNGRDQLRAFLADADDLGFHKFAAECLFSPTVAPPKVGDPQEAQFVAIVQDRRDRSEPLRVLDYGAGRGRLATAIQQAGGGQAEPLMPPGLFYFAYNGTQAPPKEVEECRHRVRELADSGRASAHYVDDIRSLQLPAAIKMDVVVLCNVLHEIPVHNWISAFKDIADVLREDGLLLLMEDQNMTIGELPTAHGFIVLDAVEVSALFGSTPGKDVREVASDHNGRLSQIEVAARVLRDATPARIAQALDFVVKRARSEVEKLRQDDHRSFRAGRSHAYFSMLHMNAVLARSTYT